MADYEFDTLDMNDIRKEASRLNKEAGGSANDDYVRMPEKDGFVLLRLLPKLKNKPFFHAVRIHRLGEYPNSKTIFCTKKLVQTPRGEQWRTVSPETECPICKEYNAMWEKSKKMPADRAKKLQDDARSIKPIERYYYNCIVRSQLNPKTNQIETNVGPKILSIGKTVHNLIWVSMSGNETTGKKGLGDVSHYQNGRDFKIVKVVRGPNGYPNYDQSFFEDPSVLGSGDQIKSWLTKYHDLEAIPNYLTIDQIEEALKSFIGEGESQPKPQVTSSKMTSSKPSTSKIEESSLDGVDDMIDEDIEAQLGNIGFGKR